MATEDGIAREQAVGTRYGYAPLGKTQRTILLVLELHHGGFRTWR